MTKGFSLLELLVTITIVGLLAAFATQNVNEYRRRAYDMHAISANKAALDAVNIFYSDYVTDERITNSSFFATQVRNILSEMGYTISGTSLTNFGQRDGIAVKIQADRTSVTSVNYEVCIVTHHTKGKNAFSFQNGEMTKVNTLSNNYYGFITSGCVLSGAGLSSSVFFMN